MLHGRHLAIVLYVGLLFVITGIVVACGNTPVQIEQPTPPPAPAAATSSSSTAVPPADEDTVAVDGEALFNGLATIEGYVGCITCHTTDSGAGISLGPSLAGIALRAGERIPDLSAEEYLRQSVIAHDDFVVEGYEPGMVSVVLSGRQFGEILSEEQIEALVEFLSTLDEEASTADHVAAVAGEPEPSATAEPEPSATAEPEPSATAEPEPSATAEPEPTIPTNTIIPLPASPTTATPPTEAPTTPPSPTPLPPPTDTPPPPPTPTPPPPSTATPAPPPTAPPQPEPIPGDLLVYENCVVCHNQHPAQVQMPHTLLPACIECHSGSPNRISCPSCHSMHAVRTTSHSAVDWNISCESCHPDGTP